jgi:hypothetical protein
MDINLEVAEGTPALLDAAGRESLPTDTPFPYDPQSEESRAEEESTTLLNFRSKAYHYDV